MAVQILQVTLGSGATQVAPPSSLNNPRKQIQEITFQNNSGAACRVGDNTVTASKGIVLGAAATYQLRPPETYGMFLEDFWLFGTAADVIDVLFVE